MANAITGTDYDLLAVFRASPGGPVVEDPEGVTLTITGPGGFSLGPLVGNTLDEDSPGLYRYTWAVPSDALVGTYVAEWSADVPDATSFDDFEVVQPSVLSTITPAVVLDRTGFTVTDVELRQATSIVGSKAGVDLLVDPMPWSLRDQRLLRTAVMWQAAYVFRHPEVFEVEANLTSASANGVSKSWGDGGAAVSLIAPLANMNIRRLSWRRSRGIPLNRVTENRQLAQTVTNDGADSDWVPLR